jgi:hypothetical protein
LDRQIQAQTCQQIELGIESVPLLTLEIPVHASRMVAVSDTPFAMEPGRVRRHLID